MRTIACLCLGFLILAGLSADARAAGCETKKHRLSSGGWVTRLILEQGGKRTVVDLQREFKRTRMTEVVHLAVNGRYRGAYPLPARLLSGQFEVYHELGNVYEPGSDGRLQLTLKSVAKVEACRYWQKIDNVRLRSSAIRFGRG